METVEFVTNGEKILVAPKKKIVLKMRPEKTRFILRFYIQSASNNRANV